MALILFTYCIQNKIIGTRNEIFHSTDEYCSSILTVDVGDIADYGAQISYAIGIAQPTSIFVNTFGTGIVPDQKIVEAIKQVFDLRPHGIIATLDLLRPIYANTSAYGHFGREEPDFTWERTDKTTKLQKAVGK